MLKPNLPLRSAIAFAVILMIGALTPWTESTAKEAGSVGEPEGAAWAQHLAVYARLPCKLLVSALAWSADGSRLAAKEGFGTGIHVWEPATRKSIFEISRVAITSNSLAFFAGGRSLIVPAGITDHQTSVFIYDVNDARLVGEVRGDAANKNNSARAFALSKEQDKLAVVASSVPDHIAIYDPRSWNLDHTIDIPNFAGDAIAFSPDGTILAIGGGNGQLAVVSAGAQPSFRMLRIQPADIPAVAFPPNGHSLLVGMGNASASNTRLPRDQNDELNRHKVREVDLATGTTLHQIDANIDDVRSISFHPSGRVFAVGGGDSVSLFDAVTFSLLTRLSDYKHVWAVAFSPDGRFLAIGSDAQVTILAL